MSNPFHNEPQPVTLTVSQLNRQAKNLLDEEARLNLSPTIPVPDYDRAGQPADSATATINTGYTRLENLLAPRTIGATLALRF